MLKVGIVVPSYNQGVYLERAIQSVISNMKYQDISLVIIDGGSTDNSVEIIKKYDKFIDYWKSEPDSGQAAAINKGVKKLKDCEYIMWLNSDDEYDNALAVKEIVDCMQKTPCEVCYGKSYFIDKNGKRIGSYPTKPFDRKRLGVECFLSQPSVLIQRKAWEELGGLDESLKLCLDYEFWIRLSQKYRFEYLDKFIGNTRMHENTKTANMQIQHLAEAICILSKYYGKVPVRWTYMWWLVNQRLVPKRIVMNKFSFKLIKLISIPIVYFKRKKIVDVARKNCSYK